MDSKEECTKIRLTVPYMRGISEALSQVFCCHAVATSMKPHLSPKRMLVHPKDKCTPQNSGVVYQVPCKDCECIYTG